jgi:exosortase
MAEMTAQIKPESATKVPMGIFAGAGLFVAALGWTMWPTLRDLFDKWMNDPGYSHGILVPPFAAYLLWARRDRVTMGQPAVWLGFGCLFLAAGVRLVSGVFIRPWMDAYAILPAAAGLALLLGGIAALRWCWPGVLFLFFMIPLPYMFERALGAPLQRVATIGSEFLLQTIGQPAVAEGNTILLNDVTLGIVDACSGLRMLVTFFAFATGVAMLIQKSWIEKATIIGSALPIAIITNILRIVATGLMYQYNSEFAHRFFHDMAGWFMMPICLMFLGIELWIMKRLVIEPQEVAPMLIR